MKYYIVKQPSFYKNPWWIALYKYTLGKKKLFQKLVVGDKFRIVSKNDIEILVETEDNKIGYIQEHLLEFCKES